MRIMKPVNLVTPLRGFEGKWVALKGDEVVAAAETMISCF